MRGKAQSKIPPAIVHILTFQTHRHAEGLVHTAHIVGRDAPGALPQAALIQRANLLGQNDAVLRKPAAVGRGGSEKTAVVMDCLAFQPH